jgi:hypothetical protein
VPEQPIEPVRTSLNEASVRASNQSKPKEELVKTSQNSQVPSRERSKDSKSRKSAERSASRDTIVRAS